MPFKGSVHFWREGIIKNIPAFMQGKGGTHNILDVVAYKKKDKCEIALCLHPLQNKKNTPEELFLNRNKNIMT